MDFSLVATGTVFPLTYTISQAYARRERATVLIANLKASVMALYYMHRDWDQSDNYPSSLGNDLSPWALKAKVLLVELMLSTKRLLTIHSDVYESLAEQRLTVMKHELLDMFEHDINLSTHKEGVSSVKLFRKLQSRDPSNIHLRDCYRAISMLSVMNEQLTVKAGYTRGGEGGLSRTNQYLRYIISNIEELRMIKQYRTPAMMRHACSLLFHIFAILLAPYFAHYCDTWIAQGHNESTCPQGYLGATFYVLIVMLLLHCEQDLEDCFDETGLDDVFFTLHEEIDNTTSAERVLLSERGSLDIIAGHTSINRMHSMNNCSPPVLATVAADFAPPPGPACLNTASDEVESYGSMHQSNDVDRKGTQESRHNLMKVSGHRQPGLALEDCKVVPGRGLISIRSGSLLQEEHINNERQSLLQ
ncbi:hypothetical protein CEUSTIGMA_g5016.t1 [Chlamydomonas eustigma]|uniref:Uncharacterized protein n=1 Tax=Chlamydomonas eustigma TaxID=1157962 RepID=A0A250X3V1_9CHLO|nr:hypothetical protein CEUSTIGMA_g5016.t1 [Chlamydomonas eustigma]|eukprot:GAX77572.1 hypothetical protein CEUSTIGMA_g5016.t1 [Chlamydomonas eustigma]